MRIKSEIFPFNELVDYDVTYIEGDDGGQAIYNGQQWKFYDAVNNEVIYVAREKENLLTLLDGAILPDPTDKTGQTRPMSPTGPTIGGKRKSRKRKRKSRKSLIKSRKSLIKSRKSLIKSRKRKRKSRKSRS